MSVLPAAKWFTALPESKPKVRFQIHLFISTGLRLGPGRMSYLNKNGKSGKKRVSGSSQSQAPCISALSPIYVHRL